MVSLFIRRKHNTDILYRGFAVSSFCVGGLIGGITGGVVQTRLGRKKAIMVNTLGWIVGSIIMGASVHEAMFIIGRLISGLSCGLGSLCIPTYIGEISTIRSRGAMGACHQYGLIRFSIRLLQLLTCILLYRFFIVVGILLSSVIGLPTAKVPLWRINYAIVGIPALVQLFLMNTCVETPRWLVAVNRVDEGRNSLKRLRGKANTDREFYEIVEGQRGSAAAASIMKSSDYGAHDMLKPGVGGEKEMHSPSLNEDRIPTPQQQQPMLGEKPNEEEALQPQSSPDPDDTATMAPRADEVSREPLSLLGIFRDPVIRRISIIVLSLHFIQQWIGMNAVMFYSTMIFSSAFNPEMSQYMAIATTGVNFVTTLLSVVLVDRMGRRALIMIAEAMCTIFSVTLVIGYRFNIPALLVVSVFLYVAGFAIGVGKSYLVWFCSVILTIVSSLFRLPGPIPWVS